MSEAEVLEVLQNAGVFRTGHFVFISGKHSDTYINKDALYPDTSELSKLCREMARRYADFGIDAIVGPAVGAAILSQWCAHHLSEMTGRVVQATYADKDGQGGFIIKRGYDRLIAGKRVLVVEDVVTTGGSMRKAVAAARDCGAEVIGAIAICNRGGIAREHVGAPQFESLVTLDLEQWPADQCELCARAIPVNTDVGHGIEFLARRQSSSAPQHVAK